MTAGNAAAATTTVTVIGFGTGGAGGDDSRAGAGRSAAADNGGRAVPTGARGNRSDSQTCRQVVDDGDGAAGCQRSRVAGRQRVGAVDADGEVAGVGLGDAHVGDRVDYRSVGGAVVVRARACRVVRVGHAGGRRHDGRGVAQRPGCGRRQRAGNRVSHRTAARQVGSGVDAVAAAACRAAGGAARGRAARPGDAGNRRRNGVGHDRSVGGVGPGVADDDGVGDGAARIDIGKTVGLRDAEVGVEVDRVGVGRSVVRRSRVCKPSRHGDVRGVRERAARRCGERAVDESVGRRSTRCEGDSRINVAGAAGRATERWQSGGASPGHAGNSRRQVVNDGASDRVCAVVGDDDGVAYGAAAIDGREAVRFGDRKVGIWSARAGQVAG